MKVIASPEHSKHFPNGELEGGVLVRPYECPERWHYIADALTANGYPAPTSPAALDRDIVAKVHTPDYLRFLQQAWSLWSAEDNTGEALPTVYPARRMTQREPAHIDGKLGFYALSIDTAITAGTWDAAISSAACAQTAASELTQGAQAMFALCRPPGHHAATDLYGGYCFLNNAAIATQTLLDQGASRIAILDVDFHHGNGTQDIFYDRSDVLFLSLHGEPQQAFPHFLGYAEETGQGAGAGFNINYPMPPKTPYSVWLQALQQALQQVSRFAPDALVISLGVDTFKHDPISFFALESADFHHYGQQLAARNLPTLFVMEGGYAVQEIGINTVNVLNGFQGGEVIS